MVALALMMGVALAQLPDCPLSALKILADASVRAQEFDLAGAAAALDAPAAESCAEAKIASAYLRGLLGAREAYRKGGGDDSLAPVREAVSALAALSKNQRGPADIARLILLAAAAAAVSEREEMLVFIDFARQKELEQRAARQPGPPMVSALEVAGDLWLQVHRYEDAQRLYELAAEHLGYTPRVLLGLGRIAVQLKQTPRACANYRKLVEWWGRRTAMPPEIAEARDYLQQPVCTAPDRQPALVTPSR